MSLTGKGGRPPGLPKTGGRQKGTPNKATQTVAEKLDALGCDPIEGMARIAMNEKNPVEVRARCYNELAQYIHAKRKAIEASIEGIRVINVNTNLEKSDDAVDGGAEPQPESAVASGEGI